MMTWPSMPKLTAATTKISGESVGSEDETRIERMPAGRRQSPPVERLPRGIPPSPTLIRLADTLQGGENAPGRALARSRRAVERGPLLAKLSRVKATASVRTTPCRKGLELEQGAGLMP